tara:strand:- start:255 stop:650 length:396 start_codon:yes stop_codon:yes gene_type:complete
MNVHDILKLYKHGYSKVTDHACREIRHGRLTKNNAIDLVKYYEKQKIIPPKHLADWLEIDLKSLNFIFNQFKNKKFWKQKNIDNWKFNGLNDGQKKNNEPKYKKTIFSYFKSKNKHSDIPSSKYIIFGKGT